MNQRTTVISDGVVCPATWQRLNGRPKILWLLKEVHEPNPHKKWSLTKTLRETAENGFSGDYRKNAPTYRLVAKTTWALTEHPGDKPIPSNAGFGRHPYHRALKSIAVLNVDETAGGLSEADTKALKVVANSPGRADELWRRIQEIQPDLVIGGNTLCFFTGDDRFFLDKADRKLIREGKRDFASRRDQDGVVWINALHPCRSGITEPKYVDLVREAWRECKGQG